MYSTRGNPHVAAQVSPFGRVHKWVEHVMWLVFMWKNDEILISLISTFCQERLWQPRSSWGFQLWCCAQRNLCDFVWIAENWCHQRKLLNYMLIVPLLFCIDAIKLIGSFRSSQVCLAYLLRTAKTCTALKFCAASDAEKSCHKKPRRYHCLLCDALSCLKKQFGIHLSVRQWHIV